MRAEKGQIAAEKGQIAAEKGQIAAEKGYSIRSSPPYGAPVKKPPHKRRFRTLDIITATAGDRDRLVVAGEVAEIQFPKKDGLSLLAAKLFFQLIEMAGAEICEAKTHSGLMQDLNWSHRDLGSIEDAVLELHRTVVSLVQETSKGKRRLSGSILAHMERPEDRKTGEIVWEFSKTFRAVVRNSHHWAAVSTRAILHMECKYSPWLYQLTALHAGREKVSEVWLLEDLRIRLGANASYLHRWQEFKRRVLEPAMAEINHLTGVRIAWEPIKRGRAVMAVRLTTWSKSGEELVEAADELDRHRVGRKDRREGTVERIFVAEEETRRLILESMRTLPNLPRNDR